MPRDIKPRAAERPATSGNRPPARRAASKQAPSEATLADREPVGLTDQRIAGGKHAAPPIFSFQAVADAEAAAKKKNKDKAPVPMRASASQPTFMTGIRAEAFRRLQTAGDAKADKAKVKLAKGEKPKDDAGPGKLYRPLDSLRPCVLPIDALVLEYLVQVCGFPLQQVIQLNAHYGCGKTTLAAEFMRMFHIFSGLNQYVDNETKHNPELFKAIHGEECYEMAFKDATASTQGWQKAISDRLGLVTKARVGTKELPGLGLDTPFLSILDSLAGKLAEQTIKKITSDGFASGGHPVEARDNTSFLKQVTSSLLGHPYALLLVNHLKEGRDADGKEIRKTPGGGHTGFQEGYELELFDKHMIERNTQFKGYKVAIRCHKNSFGESGRRANLRFLTFYEQRLDAQGVIHSVPRMLCDWGWSLIDLLSYCLGEYGDPIVKRDLRDTGFHIEIGSKGDVVNSAWSSSLGMKKEDACSWHELGHRLQTDPTTLAMLRYAFRIHMFPQLKRPEGLCQSTE